MSADIIDILTRQSRTDCYPFLSEAEAESDPVLAAMFLFAEDLLWMIPDSLDGRTIVAVAAMVVLDQFRDELPDDVITALEACRR